MKNLQKIYEEPVLHIVLVAAADIVRTSPASEGVEIDGEMWG